MLQGITAGTVAGKITVAGEIEADTTSSEGTDRRLEASVAAEPARLPSLTPEADLDPSPDPRIEIETQTDLQGHSAARSVRPRERLLATGPDGLRTHELLGVLLGSGVRGRNAEAVGEDVLSRVGGLRRLAALSPLELARLPGLGQAQAARVVACLELGRRALAQPLRRGVAFRSSADIHRHYHPLLSSIEVEQFRVVLLDGKHRVLRETLVSQGTLTSSPVHPREVFAPAIRARAAAIVLVHNHPSGDPTPSADDLDVTRRLCEVGDLVGIRVLDHVIVGDGSYTSLADRGLMRV